MIEKILDVFLMFALCMAYAHTYEDPGRYHELFVDLALFLLAADGLQRRIEK